MAAQLLLSSSSTSSSSSPCQLCCLPLSVGVSSPPPAGRSAALQSAADVGAAAVELPLPVCVSHLLSTGGGGGELERGVMTLLLRVFLVFFCFIKVFNQVRREEKESIFSHLLQRNILGERRRKVLAKPQIFFFSQEFHFKLYPVSVMDVSKAHLSRSFWNFQNKSSLTVSPVWFRFNE